jgi:AcrR family transcriptional regulator
MSDDAGERHRTARRSSARDKLLAAASGRFYGQGVGSTGIDVITADAGVAKMSLYNNFASKSALVGAYLDRRQQEFRDLHRRRIDALPSDAGPRERALAVFDAYIEHADMADDFRGCGLLNVAGELPNGDPGRDAVNRHKAEVEQMLRDALTPREGEPPSTAPEQLAEHLSLLLEGAMVRAGLDGSTDRLKRARGLAADLLSR